MPKISLSSGRARVNGTDVKERGEDDGDGATVVVAATDDDDAAGDGK